MKSVLQRLEFQLCVLLLVLGAGVFSWGINNPFIFDDIGKIVENPDLGSPDFSFSDFIYPYDENKLHNRNDPSRPLVYMIYWASRKAANGATWPFHMIGILTHAACALLVGLLAARLSHSFDGLNERWPALLATAWFFTLPLNAGTVIYIYGFSDVLALFFALLIFLFPSRLWLVALFYVLALASKQSSIVIPGLIVASDYFLGRRRWSLYLLLAALSVAYLLTRFFYFGGIGDLEAYNQYAVSTYFSLQGIMIWKYLAMLFVPISQSVEHALNPSQYQPWQCILGWSAIGLVTAGLLFQARRSKLWAFAAFAWCGFLLGLLPTSSFFPTTDLFVERRAYMGSAFFILASSVLLWSLKFRTWAMGIATFLVAANTYASYRQVRIYGDEERLWRETLALYPRDERAILNLSTYYLRNGKFKEAQSTLEGLLKMYPGYYGGLVNMGGLFQHYENPNRDPKCAIEFYNQALQVEPTNLNALMNGGLVLVELRRFAEARVHFEKIITLSPRMAQAHANLGRVGLVTGDPALAQRHLSEAVRLNPGDSASAAILDKLKPQ